MKSRTIWILVASAALVIVWVGMRPVFTVCGPSAVAGNATSETKQVAVALKMHVADHQGHLPNSLEELVPSYLPAKTYFANTYLTTPNAILSDLPPDLIIAFRVVPDIRRRETVILFVRSDYSVTRKYQ